MRMRRGNRVSFSFARSAAVNPVAVVRRPPHCFVVTRWISAWFRNVWLIPPHSLHFLTQETARNILRWTVAPKPTEWWGVLWLKAHAFKAMRKSVETARRKAESELDVPSDEEEMSQPTKATTTTTTTPIAPPPTQGASRHVLQMIQDPAAAASTASYLTALLSKITPATPAGGSSTTPAAASTTSLASIIASIRDSQTVTTAPTVPTVPVPSHLPPLPPVTYAPTAGAPTPMHSQYVPTSGWQHAAIAPTSAGMYASTPPPPMSVPPSSGWQSSQLHPVAPTAPYLQAPPFAHPPAVSYATPMVHATTAAWTTAHLQQPTMTNQQWR
jgi:hypothetical protein